MGLPLSGVKVLDLTNVLAGPFCGYQLAQLGAEVVKIESPVRGDLARSLGADPDAARQGMGASYVAVNAGKQSVTLNLKHPEGKQIFERLAAGADVLIENFRPGVMARLGLGYEPLSALNPRLVYCAITGFGQDGPLAGRPAYDQIVQGLAGVMSVTGDGETAPMRVGFPICDTLGGVTAAFAITAALYEARATGRGRLVDVSMLEATLASMGWVISNYLNAQVEPSPIGNENFTAAPSGTFRTADGLLNISANEQKQFEALCACLGRPDLVQDPRFWDRYARREHREALNEELARALAARGALEWEELLVQAGVPAGRVLSVPEILRHPQVTERGFLARLEGPRGPQHVTRAGFRLSGAEVGPSGPAPALSSDTERWLRALGYGPADLARLRAEGVI